GKIDKQDQDDRPFSEVENSIFQEVFFAGPKDDRKGRHRQGWLGDLVNTWSILVRFHRSVAGYNLEKSYENKGDIFETRFVPKGGVAQLLHYLAISSLFGPKNSGRHRNAVEFCSYGLPRAQSHKVRLVAIFSVK